MGLASRRSKVNMVRLFIVGRLERPEGDANFDATLRVGHRQQKSGQSDFEHFGSLPSSGTSRAGEPRHVGAVMLRAAGDAKIADPNSFDRKKGSMAGDPPYLNSDCPDPGISAKADPIEANRKPPWRPRVVRSSQQLLDHFSAYEKETKNNPILEEVLFAYEGRVMRHFLRKARPFTLSGFCSFLGVSAQSWRYWRKNRRDLSSAIEMIEDAIYVQKFEGAAAGIFKANIISRDLGAKHSSR